MTKFHKNMLSMKMGKNHCLDLGITIGVKKYIFEFLLLLSDTNVWLAVGNFAKSPYDKYPSMAHSDFHFIVFIELGSGFQFTICHFFRSSRHQFRSRFEFRFPVVILSSCSRVY